MEIMENELNLLMFEVEDEIFRFGADTKVTILYLKEDGQYLDHYVDSSEDRNPPQAITKLIEDIEFHKTTLSEFHKAILYEMNSRIASKASN